MSRGNCFQKYISVRLHSAVIALVATLGTLVASCGKGESAASTQPSHTPSGKTIKILWAKWAPAEALQKLSADYTRQTGNLVYVDQQSWNGAFSQTNQTEFNNNGTTYDIIVGDSQWLGQG